MTFEEHDAMLSKMTPEELNLYSWYAQFPNGDELQRNYRIHCKLSTAIKNCNVRELAVEMERAIRNRAWENMPEYPGNDIFGKVLNLSFVDWVENHLFSSVDTLMRLMSGQLPDADKAGDAAIAMIDALQEEDPDTLKVLMHSKADSNLPGWRQLVDSKAKECNGKWTQCSAHLSDITAGKVGGDRRSEKFQTASGAVCSDPTRDDRSRPTNERERQRVRLRGLKDNPAKCAAIGITAEGAQAAFEAMCTSATIPIAEIHRIAGFKEKPRKRIEIAHALTPDRVAGKLISFFGREKAAAIAAATTSLLNQ